MNPDKLIISWNYSCVYDKYYALSEKIMKVMLHERVSCFKILRKSSENMKIGQIADYNNFINSMNE